MTAMDRHTGKGFSLYGPHLSVMAAAIIFGSSGSFIKYLAMPVATITFFRLAVPSLVLFCIFAARGRRLRSPGMGWMLFASLLNAARIFLYFYGFTHTTIGNAILLLYTWPVFAALFGALLLKERMTPAKTGAALIAPCGVGLIYLRQSSTGGGYETAGMAAMVLSALIYALTIILFKRESSRHDQWEMVFFQNIAGAFLFLPFFIANGMPSPSGAAVAVLYAGLVGLAGFGLFFHALRRIEASVASLITYIEVVSAVFFASIFFNEAITGGMAAGGILIIISCLIVERSNAREIVKPGV